MNIAVIFAGGVGKRMGLTDRPKQFMKIVEKPIIIHTLEWFEKNKDIDYIVISVLKSWIEPLKQMIKDYNLTKVTAIVEGGETGQMSIFNGIKKAYEMYPKDSVVLIHDGVRPFVTDELISENIFVTRKHRSAISCVFATETFLIVDDEKTVCSIPERNSSLIAKAPQCFILEDIYEGHLKAQGILKYDFIDSCTLMNYFGYPLHVTMTDYDNIKITTPKDIALAESIYKRRKAEREGKENVQE